MSATLACQTVDPGEYDVYKKQTFAIDFRAISKLLLRHFAQS